jgi:penicillin-binding protein 1A
VTDAFKPEQVPGASHPMGSGVAAAPTGPDGTTPAGAAQTVHGGVDSSLGGIY